MKRDAIRFAPSRIGPAILRLVMEIAIKNN